MNSFISTSDFTFFLSIDETWWKAEFDGKTGVVPSNYVELIV